VKRRTAFASLPGSDIPTITVRENGTYRRRRQSRWLRTADGFAVLNGQGTAADGKDLESRVFFSRSHGRSPLLRHTIWQVLFRRRRRFAEPSASAVKCPTISDFHTVVAKAGVSVTFKPTNSTYIFYRLTNSNDLAGLGQVSFVGVQHAGHGTEDYPSDEVQERAQRIASEHPLIHFGQFPDETDSTPAR
jgi:hypothetical protein